MQMVIKLVIKINRKLQNKSDWTALSRTTIACLLMVEDVIDDVELIWEKCVINFI